MAAQGQQMRLQRRVAELQEERARIMEPLQMKALEQQNMLQALKIKQAELEQTYTVQIESAFTQASELLSKSKLTDPSVQNQLFTLFERVPQALGDTRFKSIMETVDAAQRLDEMRSRVRGQASMSGDLATTQMATELRLKLEDPNLPPAERRRAVIQLEELRTATADKAGMTVYDPATGKPLMTTGGVKPLVPSSIAKLNSGSNAQRALNELGKVMTTETMGIGGKFWDVAGALFGQTKATTDMLSSDAKEKIGQRQTFEVLAQDVKTFIIQELKSDGNINQKELDRLEKIPPGDWIFDNPLTGKPRLDRIKKMIIDIRRRSYDRPENGGPPLPYEPDMLTPTELADSYVRGAVKVSKPQLLELIESSPYPEQLPQAFNILKGALSGRP
jgi:hypothetical protein